MMLLELGPFRLDLPKRRLTYSGEHVALPGRSFDVLRVLVEAQGGLVTKDRLMETVWAGRIVEENNVEVHISNLRRALAHHAPGTNLILTTPGQGYQLHPSAFQDKATFAPANPVKGASIAVMPFTNMSGDPDQDYFADGIVEDILTALARIRLLQVTARNSSFIYKGTSVDIREAAANLGVQYILEGGIRKSGQRVRISAQLIEADTGAHIWAEKFDRVLDDIFAVQDEITHSVVGAIEPNLRHAEIQRAVKRPQSLQAYDLLLRALPYTHRRMVEDANLAIPLLTQAVEYEPGYALAHAFLAQAYHFRFSRGGLNEQDRLAATQHARIAISSGTDDATTLAIAGIVLWFDDHDVATALSCFERALATTGSNVIALGNDAFVRAWMGETQIAIEQARRALQISPFDTLNAYLALAIAHFVDGDFQLSQDAARRAVAAAPTFSVPYALLAASSVRKGEDAVAVAALQSLRRLDPNFSTDNWSRTVGVAGSSYADIAAAIRAPGIVP